MSDNYQCKWCKRTDEKVMAMTQGDLVVRGAVLEWTVREGQWRKIIAIFYAHRECQNKEMSANGDGSGVRVTA